MILTFVGYIEIPGWLAHSISSSCGPRDQEGSAPFELHLEVRQAWPNGKDNPAVSEGADEKKCAEDIARCDAMDASIGVGEVLH